MSLNAGFQELEQRDSNDVIVKEGVVSKKSPFANADNTGIYDIIAEDLRYLYEKLSNVESANDLSAIRDEVQQMYTDMTTNEKFGSIEATAQAKIATEQAKIATDKAKEVADSLSAYNQDKASINDNIVEINGLITEARGYLDSIAEVENDIATDVQVAKNNATKATNQATSSQNSAELSQAWAMSAGSPDDADDTLSTTGKTMSAKGWALRAKDEHAAAQASASSAKSSEDNASLSESNASTSAFNAKESENKAKASEGKAATSESNAKESETNASTSATNAAESASAAKVSETNAKDSEGKASASELHAKSSEDNAKLSETNAKTSETNAAKSEVKAKTSEDRAKLSEVNAKTSEEKAATSELNAKTSEDNAKESETNAAQSAASASASAGNAAISEENAKAWAEGTPADEIIQTEKTVTNEDGTVEVVTVNTTVSHKSAKTWATESKQSATTAKEQMESATASADSAKTSEDNAKESEEKASASETNAKDYMNNAKSSADAANLSAQNAMTSEELSQAWAMSADSPDGRFDEDSSNGLTQSSKSWASKAKASATSANEDATRTQGYVENVQALVEQANAIKKTINDYSAMIETMKSQCESLLAESRRIRDTISDAVIYKGSVNSFADLPTENNNIGDMYNVVAPDQEHGIKANDNVVWNGEDWDNMGGAVDTATLAHLNTDVTFSSVEADLFTGHLAGKADSATTADSANSVAWENVAGKPTSLPANGGTADRALKADVCTGNAASASAVAWNNVTEKPTAFPPSSHSHSWESITSKPSTFPPSSHNHDSAYPSTTGTRASGTWGISISGTSAAAEKIKIPDTRNINKNPQQCMADSGYALNADFKSKGTIGIGGTGTYAGLLTFAPWGDASGGYPTQIACDPGDGRMYYRWGTSGTAWSGWKALAYTDDKPSTAGTADVAKFAKVAISANAVAWANVSGKSTGTASVPGLTKLYTALGDNTDGTMTQKAIKALLGSGGGGIVAASLSANGYAKFANGFTVQWGYSTTTTVTFPIAFDSACYSMTTCRRESSYACLETSEPLTKTTAHLDEENCWWIAVGK